MSQVEKYQTERMLVQNWAKHLNNLQQHRTLVDELKSILSPAVLRHLPEPLQLADGQDAIDDWIAARAAESDVLTIRDLATSELLGLLILAEFPEPNAPTTVHLGYLFSESAWGKGYATELLSGLIDWLRGKDQSVQLLGGVEKENVASARVLQKNGFEKAEELSIGSTDMFRLVT